MRYLFDFDEKNRNSNKEILQLFILDSLMKSDYLKRFVFHGGTALRLCHQGLRFSEDLDFTGNISGVEMRELAEFFKNDLEMKIQNRLEVSFNEKEKTVRDIMVKVFPENRQIKQVMVKFEVADIPFLSPRDMIARSKYMADLTVFVLAETREEILSDKVVAFGTRTYIKYRDIWDIAWLDENGVVASPETVLQKLKDYKEDLNDYYSDFDQRLEFLVTAPEAIREFRNELFRFVDENYKRILQDDDFVKGQVEKAAKFLKAFLK